MKTMMKLFVMMLVVTVLAPSALATFNAGDVRIWTYDDRALTGGRTAIYRSNAWPVGGTTTMQVSTLIDSAGAPQTFPPDPVGWDVLGDYVYIAIAPSNRIRRYDLDGKIAPLGMTEIQPGDFSNDAGGFRGIAASDQAGSKGLYVSDACPGCPNDPSGEIRRYNLGGSFHSMSYEKSNPRTSAPWGVLSKDPGKVAIYNSRLYVQSSSGPGNTNDIRVFDLSNGSYLGSLGNFSGSGSGAKIAIRADGTLFALEQNGGATRVRTWKVGTGAVPASYVDQGTFGEAIPSSTPLIISARDIDIDPRTGALIVLAHDNTNDLNKLLQFGSQTGDFIQEIASWPRNESPSGNAAQILIVPEPATLGLLTLGGLLILRRRR